MKLYILFGQRKQRYAGQYAPETLAVNDEYSHDENPDFLNDLLTEHSESDDFDAVKIIPIEVSMEQIQAQLNPSEVVIEGTILAASPGGEG